MMEPIQSIRRERGEARRASQAFRDLGFLLVLILLVSSVRFQPADADPALNPLPGGVQAAETEQAEPPAVEPAVVPALATPDPATRSEIPSIAELRSLRQDVDTQTRVLVVTGETVREIRFPSRITIRAFGASCSESRVEPLTRS